MFIQCEKDKRMKHLPKSFFLTLRWWFTAMTIQEIWNEIYVGDVVSLTDVKIREELGIGAVLDCTKELKSIRRDGENYLKLNLVDCIELDKKSIEEGLLFMQKNRGEERKVLVACAAGMSRSPSFVLAYMVSNGWDFYDAYNHIKKKRPIVSIDYKIVKSLKRCFGVKW